MTSQIFMRAVSGSGVALQDALERAAERGQRFALFVDCEEGVMPGVSGRVQRIPVFTEEPIPVLGWLNHLPKCEDGFETVQAHFDRDPVRGASGISQVTLQIHPPYLTEPGVRAVYMG